MTILFITLQANLNLNVLNDNQSEDSIWRDPGQCEWMTLVETVNLCYLSETRHSLFTEAECLHGGGPGLAPGRRPDAAQQEPEPRAEEQHGVPGPHQRPVRSYERPRSPPDVEVQPQSVWRQGPVWTSRLPPLLCHPLHHQAHHLPVKQHLLRGPPVLTQSSLLNCI